MKRSGTLDGPKRFGKSRSWYVYKLKDQIKYFEQVFVLIRKLGGSRKDPQRTLFVPGIRHSNELIKFLKYFHYIRDFSPTFAS